MDKIPPDVISILRRLSCKETLESLGVYHSRDLSFKPRKHPSTASYFVEAQKFTGELIFTGPKFFCPRLSKGGCGAIDLTIFLFGCSFMEAMEMLGALND